MINCQHRLDLDCLATSLLKRFCWKTKNKTEIPIGSVTKQSKGHGNIHTITLRWFKIWYVHAFLWLKHEWHNSYRDVKQKLKRHNSSDQNSLINSHSGGLKHQINPHPTFCNLHLEGEPSLGMRWLCWHNFKHNWYICLRIREIMLVFWGYDEALTAADCTNLSKNWDILIKQSIILII